MSVARIVRGALGASFLLLVACATSSSSKLATYTGPQMNFEMISGATQASAVITPGGAQGPTIDLGRYDDGATLRGTVRNQPFQMSVTPAKATGQWGQQPITVEVKETATDMVMNGLVAGQLSAWTANATSIQGKIGLCSYDLGRVGDTYQGTSTCGGQTTVKFPVNIAEWKTINVAVLMALLMSSP